MIEKKEDERGWLAELIKDRKFGQVFIVVAKPGTVRGNHYHKRKTEGFLVLEGQAELKLIDVETGEDKTLALRGDHPVYVVLPPLVAHSLRALSKMMLLITTSEEFDKADPDTYVYDSFR